MFYRTLPVFQKVRHRAIATCVRLPSAEILINLQQTLPCQMGSDVRWRKWNSQQTEAGGTKYAGISADRPRNHTLHEIFL